MGRLFYTTNEMRDLLYDLSRFHIDYRIHQPAFFVEKAYLDFFYFLVRCMPRPNDDDIISSVHQVVYNFYIEATEQVGAVLRQHSVDSSYIWKLLYYQQPILRKEQQRYNRQIPGPSPKGITGKIWNDYNHWLIAMNLWKGFVKSLDPSFSVVIPSDIDEDIHKLLIPELKPLWGMYEAYQELGRPIFAGGNCGDAIYTKMWMPLNEFRKKITGAGKDFRNARYNPR